MTKGRPVHDPGCGRRCSRPTTPRRSPRRARSRCSSSRARNDEQIPVASTLAARRITSAGLHQDLATLGVSRPEPRGRDRAVGRRHGALDHRPFRGTSRPRPVRAEGAGRHRRQDLRVGPEPGGCRSLTLTSGKEPPAAEGAPRGATEDHQRRRPRRRARARLADLAAAEVPGEGPADRTQALGRVLAQARREVRQHRRRRGPVGRRLVLRGPAHLRPQAVRRDPARGDARRRPVEVRPHEDGDGSAHVRRDAPGLLRARSAHQGLRAELGRRFAAVPHVPALLRADVPRSRRQRPRSRVRQGIQRLDGRGVVRAVGRHEHPALHHAALGRRARGRRDQAQRGSAAYARSASASSPTT